MTLDSKGLPMYAVTLKKKGFIIHNQKTVESDALMLLSFQITLEEGYSLRSFFQMIDKYTVLARLNWFFPTCTEEYRTCPSKGCDCNTIDHLEFGKTVEMIGVPEKRLEIYNSLSGVCGNATLEIKSMPLKNLLDMPLMLGKLKHVVFGDHPDIFEFDTVFTLFEFIDGIAWELGFHATPEQCELGR